MRKASIVVLALCVLSPFLARANDDDPEPPGKGGPELRNLRGKWVSVGMKWKGKEAKGSAGVTYVFEGDKVTTKNSRAEYVSKVKVDAKRKPPVLELTRENTKTTTRYAFKIDKDRLFLGAGARADEDFSGDNGPVLILEREKKDK